MKVTPPLTVTVLGGTHIVAPNTRMIVGRGLDADIVIADPHVSRRHVLLFAEPGGCWVLDDLSNSGTYEHASGRRLKRVSIDGRCSVRLGHPRTGPILECVPGITDPTPPFEQHRLRVGRAMDNDIVLPDLLVSRHHAELHGSDSGQFILTDLQSTTGTFVDGKRVTAVSLRGGERVTIGGASLEFDGRKLSPLDEGGVPALSARDLVVIADNKRILQDVSFDINRGSFVAVVGPTGAGKSTLVKAMTGFRPPEEGTVLLHGRDLYGAFEELRRGVGYVPQEETLHPQLSARESLEFGAALRFPRDVSTAERRQRLEGILVELGLSDHADLPIEKLSGGQRKRTSMAIELLTAPAVLILDEPTSGLDPWVEKTVMELLRRLADSGQTIIVVTHVVANLHLCDQVLFLATGGRTAFYGPPAQSLAFFGRNDYTEVFRDLGGNPSDWRPRPASRTRRREPAALPAGMPLPPSVPWLSQVWTLICRHSAILTSDWRNAVFFAAEVLIPAVLIAALIDRRSLVVGAGDGHAGRTLLAAIIVSASVMGAANALREIVKESPIYLRERAIGLARSAYLAAKVVVLGTLTTIQVVLLVLLATIRAGGPHASLGPFPPMLELVAIVALAGLAAVALGLAISSLVSTSEKAMALIAVVFIAEWLFSGAAIDLQRSPVVQPVAYLAGANWAMAAASASVDLATLGPAACGTVGGGTPRRSQESSCEGRWRHDPRSLSIDIAGLLTITAGALLMADLGLKRREPRRRRQRSPSEPKIT